jgi:hypothetical protein
MMTTRYMLCRQVVTSLMYDELIYIIYIRHQFIPQREHTVIRLETTLVLLVLKITRNTNTRCAVLHSVLYLAVPTVTAVFERANYCVKCAKGGPSTGSDLKNSGWVEQRRWISEQPLKYLSTLTAQE